MLLTITGLAGKPLTRPSATLSPSDGERDGVRGVWCIPPFLIGNWYHPPNLAIIRQCGLTRIPLQPAPGDLREAPKRNLSSSVTTPEILRRKEWKPNTGIYDKSVFDERQPRTTSSLLQMKNTSCQIGRAHV